tara:strand:- start:6617 stop:6964 length:348 start_codon:yes stop_codon:yes gene_type:complete
MAEATDAGKEASVELPGGTKLSAKGYNVVSLALFGGTLALCGVLYLLWEHKQDSAANQRHLAAAMDKTNAEVTAAFKEVSTSQRLFACIIAQPQDVRLTEFSNENSFCGRMSKLR